MMTGSTPSGRSRSNAVADGLTLRDYFAGQIVAGLGAPVVAQGRHGGTWNYDGELAARSAYRMADLMIAARTQEDTPQRSCHPIPSDELVEAARIAEQVIDRVLDMDEKALNSLEAVRNRLRTALSLPRKTEAEIRADEREKVVAEVVTESLFDGIEAVCGMLEATVGDLTHDEREDLKVCRDFLRSHTQGEG